MPAIVVDDITVLPRILEPDPMVARQRAVRSITSAPRGLEGEGFPVRRAFAGVDLAELDPFVHLDQMGEVDYAPGEPKGTAWHPHRGFETVTYMIDGTFEHSDSNGGGGVITNGDTQWMTAGAGILHIEKPPEALVVSGGLFHGFQLWVNLPRALKWAAPRYQDLRAREVALVSSSDGGALVRVIAGDVAGHAGPGSTYSPMTLAHVTLSPGARLSIPWRADYNALAYVMAGRGTVGVEASPVQTGQLAVFGPGTALTVAAGRLQEGRSPNLDVLLLGGRPIREPVAWMGPFVMNTREEVIQAFEDYQAGRLGTHPRGGSGRGSPQHADDGRGVEGKRRGSRRVASTSTALAVQEPGPIVPFAGDRTRLGHAVVPLARDGGGQSRVVRVGGCPGWRGRAVAKGPRRTRFRCLISPTLTATCSSSGASTTPSTSWSVTSPARTPAMPGSWSVAWRDAALTD